MDYKNQPLIYVATESQYNALGLNDDKKKASAAFIAGPQRKITTHNTDFFCGTSDVEGRFTNINTSLTNIINRLDNIDGQNGNNTLAGRVARLETLMKLINPEDKNPQNTIADFLDQLQNLIDSMGEQGDQITTIINNNLADIDFWYTYGE